MTDYDVILGNSTAIATWIITTLAASAGLDYLIPSNLSVIIGAVLGLIFALINSKYPNKFGGWFGNKQKTTTNNNTNIEEELQDPLNEEYTA